MVPLPICRLASYLHAVSRSSSLHAPSQFSFTATDQSRPHWSSTCTSGLGHMLNWHTPDLVYTLLNWHSPDQSNTSSYHHIDSVASKYSRSRLYFDRLRLVPLFLGMLWPSETGTFNSWYQVGTSYFLPSSKCWLHIFHFLIDDVPPECVPNGFFDSLG